MCKKRKAPKFSADPVERASLVRAIATDGFKDAIHVGGLMTIAANLEGLDPARVHAAGAERARSTIFLALLENILLKAGRAFDGVQRESDRHARVAFDLLQDPATLDEVATRGNRQKLEEAIRLWEGAKKEHFQYMRRFIKHYRDKQLAHWAVRKNLRSPTVDEIGNTATMARMVWLRLAEGALGTLPEHAKAVEATGLSARALFDAFRRHKRVEPT